jgi:hypothetical protein
MLPLLMRSHGSERSISASSVSLSTLLASTCVFAVMIELRTKPCDITDLGPNFISTVTATSESGSAFL